MNRVLIFIVSFFIFSGCYKKDEKKVEPTTIHITGKVVDFDTGESLGYSFINITKRERTIGGWTSPLKNVQADINGMYEISFQTDSKYSNNIGALSENYNTIYLSIDRFKSHQVINFRLKKL
jgi:hypothetical protein